jgi:hypothetical protein
MVEKIIVVTNNPLSDKELKTKYEVLFIDGTVMDVFMRVRDLIHKGHKLLTHPLMSSIKPNETPFRTIILTKESHNIIDMQSLGYIEEGIHTTEKFLKNYGIPDWDESTISDFELIDFDLISHALS